MDGRAEARRARAGVSQKRTLCRVPAIWHTTKIFFLFFLITSPCVHDLAHGKKNFDYFFNYFAVSRQGWHTAKGF